MQRPDERLHIRRGGMRAHPTGDILATIQVPYGTVDDLCTARGEPAQGKLHDALQQWRMQYVLDRSGHTLQQPLFSFLAVLLPLPRWLIAPLPLRTGNVY